jgi:coenzyme F420-reducing hydrogenase delta subunit
MRRLVIAAICALLVAGCGDAIKKERQGADALAYTVDQKIVSGPHRTECFVITDPSSTDRRLRNLLILLNQKGNDSATTAVFFASQKKADKDQLFAYGEYAADERGMRFLSLEGEPPKARIER